MTTRFPFRYPEKRSCHDEAPLDVVAVKPRDLAVYREPSKEFE
jgi:hypothetical protein